MTEAKSHDESIRPKDSDQPKQKRQRPRQAQEKAQRRAEEARQDGKKDKDAPKQRKLSACPQCSARLLVFARGRFTSWLPWPLIGRLQDLTKMVCNLIIAPVHFVLKIVLFLLKDIKFLLKCIDSSRIIAGRIGYNLHDVPCRSFASDLSLGLGLFA